MTSQPLGYHSDAAAQQLIELEFGPFAEEQDVLAGLVRRVGRVGEVLRPLRDGLQQRGEPLPVGGAAQSHPSHLHTLLIPAQRDSRVIHTHSSYLHRETVESSTHTPHT